MPIPNLLKKHGIESGEKKKSGIPNLIETKYKNFAEEPASVVTPPAKPGFFDDQRVGGIIKNTITGIPKALWNFLGPGQIQDYLKTSEGQEAAFNLTPRDIGKNVLPTAGKMLADIPLALGGVVTGPKIYNIPGLGPTPNIQQQASQKVEAGMSPARATIEAVPQAIFDVLALYGGITKLTSPREIPLTRPGSAKFDIIPESPGPKTGRLYEPKNYVAAVKPEAFNRVITENNIPVRTDFNPNNPIIFRMVDGTRGQFFQIRPSYLKTFIDILKGDPTKVPTTQIVPITSAVSSAEIKPPTVPQAPVVPTVPTVKPSSPAVPVAPTVPLEVAPTAPTTVKEIIAGMKAKKLTVQPEVPIKEKVSPGNVPVPIAEIGGVKIVRPDQLVTKTQVKDLLKGIGSDSVDFTVEKIDGQLYMTYNDAKNDMRLKPSALGLIETNITPGQTININSTDLKETGTGFKAVNEEGGVEASLSGDLSNPDLPAKTPGELVKMIEQLNKVGQAYGVLRKTGGVSKKAFGHFAQPTPKGMRTKRKIEEPKGRVELRDDTVLSPRNYMSTLAHELGHAIDFAVNGNTKNSFDTFGKNLSADVKKKIHTELMAITNDFVGEAVASAKPGYYYKPTEMLARFLEKMFVSPGNIAEIAPTAVEYFDKASIKYPIIAEFLDAVQGSIDKGQIKHIFARDMKQTYEKALGKRVGDIAWNHEVNYRAMKERAKIQIEKLIDQKFKGIDDDPELLFNAVESIKITKDGEPVFSTRDFANAKNDKEEFDLIQNDYEPVMNEKGSIQHDLVEGKLLPRFAKVRYTPEQGKTFFDGLSPAGQKLVKDFTAARDEAQDYFNREVIKDVHKIKSNIEGWVHHYWDDKIGGVGGKTLKTKQASATRKRKGAEGYEKNLKDAMQKALTELNTTEAYNKFIQDFFPTVTKPIAKGQEPEDGWVEVFGNIYKGGVGTAGETRTVIVKDGESFSANKPRYQMPKIVYKRYQMLKEPAEDANSMMRVLNSVMRYWRVNILFHMGSNSTNFISGGLQYSSKIVKDFYSEILTGNITMPQTRSNVFALITTLMPRGWQNAPDWIYGGDLSNSYGQFTGSEKHPGIEALDKGVDAYADKALKVYGLVERYWKKVIMNSEGIKDLSHLDMITKEGLKLPTKEEQDLISAINEQVDLFGLDYDNVPVQLAQYKRGVLGQALKPFAVFPYKITKLYTRLIEDAFDGTKSWQDRLSSIMALGTLVAIAAWFIEERRKKQKTPAVGDNAPGAVKSAGRVLVGEDEAGNEMFTKISKYPFINVAEAGVQISDGNIDAAYQVIRDMIGSVGPGGQVAAAILGYKNEYQQYMPPSVIAGQALSTFVPAARILNDIATYKDPYQRKQQTFLQGFTSFYPTSNPELQEKLRGKIRTINIPLEAGVRPAGDMPEGTRRTTTDRFVRNYKNDILLQALAGIYIKRIDPVEAEAFNVRAEKNAADDDKKGPVTSF